MTVQLENTVKSAMKQNDIHTLKYVMEVLMTEEELFVASDRLETLSRKYFKGVSR